MASSCASHPPGALIGCIRSGVFPGCFRERSSSLRRPARMQSSGKAIPVLAASWPNIRQRSRRTAQVSLVQSRRAYVCAVVWRCASLPVRALADDPLCRLPAVEVVGTTPLPGLGLAAGPDSRARADGEVAGDRAQQRHRPAGVHESLPRQRLRQRHPEQSASSRTSTTAATRRRRCSARRRACRSTWTACG